MVKYAAILACGNYHGVVGYAKAKGPAIPIALQKVSFCALNCPELYFFIKFWERKEFYFLPA